MGGVDRPELPTLPARLSQVVSADELDLATRSLEGSGVTRSFRTGRPELTLELDPPADARALCAAWGIERPVAVSPDVHQSTWSVLVAGDELADPHAKRIASKRITAGRWDVVPRLSARPAGELPGVVSGASPAYDIVERGGAVASIEIAPTAHPVRAFAPDHPDAMQLLGAMASAEPAWRGGWTADPAATFVVVYDGSGPVAGASVSDGWLVTKICMLEDGYGAALLDALEALARERGQTRVRLDSSAFLGDWLPYARYGYEVGPPYEGDADVDVWAEKDLAL
jgi:hypothetical protein